MPLFAHGGDLALDEALLKCCPRPPRLVVSLKLQPRSSAELGGQVLNGAGPRGGVGNLRQIGFLEQDELRVARDPARKRIGQTDSGGMRKRGDIVGAAKSSGGNRDRGAQHVHVGVALCQHAPCGFGSDRHRLRHKATGLFDARPEFPDGAEFGEVATIREGLEHLSSGQAEALELLRAEDERLVDAIAAVAKSVEDLGGVAHLDPDTGTAVDRDALDAFRERIDRLESGNAWEDRIAAVVEDLEALRIRQEEIAAAGTDSSALERFEKRIEFIDAGLGEALEGRVSTERHQQDVDELMGLIEAHAVDPAALEELRAHLEEHAEAFGARIDEATARADEERSRLGDRAEQLADEIRSLSAEAARTSELSQLQEGLAALADEQASVEARLAEIAGQVETNRKAADRDEVVQLREALDALAQETRNHLDTLRHTHDEHAEAFGARIDEATARADEERSRLGDRAEQLADEIRSLSAEAARTSELSQLQEGLAALADEQASVEARLAEIAGQVETNRKAADRDEVVQLREALDALAQETRNHLDTLRHTHDEHAEAFGARIDEATARADEERSRLGDRAEQLADEIRSLSAEAARTSELSQLQEGLAALADEQASVEARLAEIAGQVETNRKAADRDEVVQLREALDALAQETRNHLDTLRHTHDEHAAANEDQTARVESLATDVSSVRNELQTSLEAIRTSNSADARAAEHRNYELEALVAALGPRLDDLDSRLTAASELAAAPSDGATKLVRELETTIEDLEGRLEARVNELAGRMGDEASAIASRLAGLDNCVQEQTATHERTAKELEALGYEMRKGAAASGEAIRRIDASVQAHAETAASLDHLRAVEATIGEVSSLLESLSRMRASDAAQNDERVHALEASFALFEDKLNEIETVTGTELDARRAEALAAEAALRRADDALARVDEIAAEIAAERLLHAAADDPEAPVADACVDKASKKKAKKRKHDGKAKKKRS